ncbi:hypothetical protein J3R30DRAFT_1353424 [Lentinula aciculospora]|uniref:Uncharacterized protein n=1 Tax=Lentinula aciculospora TaxID=153920 RepID=A0A9W9AL46_9AGAR|nr:hypothetical protein J3R30DRAFT_1353424 [Lentinula aciculospora]
MGFDHKTGLQQHSLITPSASPPSRSHSFSSKPPTNAIASSKNIPSSGSSVRSRSRFSSTPVSTLETPDIPTLRSQSTSRLLSVWSTLADRYSLRVDEDDIVDIRTGQLVKDRGVVRGLNGKWDFGRFAAADGDGGDDQIEDDDGGRETEGAEEESDDELDSFADIDHQQQVQFENVEAGIGVPVNPFMAFSNLTARATHAIDPTNDEDDAADLRAFLEAERLRKETQGDIEEQDGTSSGELRMEDDGSEFMTELDTETEAGFTTEGEHFSEFDEVRIADEEPARKQSLIVQEGEGSEDELEIWDASDFDIILSSDNAPEISYPRSPSSRLTASSHTHLFTPPNSSTYSESYTDIIEPLVSSPPTHSKIRSKSRPRASDEQRQKAIRKPLTPSPPSSLPSASSPFVGSSKIPRLDLSRLSNLRRGRSQSRSPSKPVQRDNEDPKGTPTVEAPERLYRSAKPELSELRSVASSSSNSLTSIREATGTPSSSKTNVRNSGNSKGKGKGRAGTYNTGESLPVARIKPNTIDVKGKGKAREIIEIGDLSDELSVEFVLPPLSPRKNSAKAKGKKRARSSGASWSSKEEERENSQQVGGNMIAEQRKVKPMGSPTKKGRYTVLSESESEEVLYHTKSVPSTVNLPLSSPSKSSFHKASRNTPFEQRRRDDSFHRQKRESNARMHEDENDESFYLRPGDGSKSRARTNSHRHRVMTDQLSDSNSDQLGHPSAVDDYPMHPQSISRHDYAYCSRDSSIADSGHSDSMLLPRRAASQLQMQKTLEGRAKDIISNAIQGLYSLLTPEGMTALQGQIQEKGSMSSSYRHRISQSSPIRDIDTMVYTPQRASGHRHDPDASITSSSRSLPLKANSSFLYSTPTSHRNRQNRQSQSYNNPNYSRGTLPPSSPRSESDDEHGHNDFDASDELNFNVDEQRTSSSPVIIHSSPVRPRECSGPNNLHDLPNSRPRASSIVQRSRSRGRRVSFKEIASQTQSKTGETQRTLSREISVDDPELEVYQKGRRVEVDSINSDHELEVGDEHIREGNETRRRVRPQSRRRSVVSLIERAPSASAFTRRY